MCGQQAVGEVRGPEVGGSRGWGWGAPPEIADEPVEVDSVAGPRDVVVVVAEARALEGARLARVEVHGRGGEEAALGGSPGRRQAGGSAQQGGDLVENLEGLGSGQGDGPPSLVEGLGAGLEDVPGTVSICREGWAVLSVLCLART